VSRSADIRQRFSRGSRRLRTDERGVTSLEFAVVGGLLFLILFATVDFGRALAARNEMSHALGRATRVVNLNPETTPEQVQALLEGYLTNYEETDLSVEIDELSGTTYMRISVSFPFHSSLPFRPDEVRLNVSTLAPMVSPTL
jgi:Flp pilus assembly protein TadG